MRKFLPKERCIAVPFKLFAVPIMHKGTFEYWVRFSQRYW